MTLRETFINEARSRIDDDIQFMFETRNKDYIKWLEEHLEAKMKQNLLMSKDLGELMGEQSILENRIKEVNKVRIHREIEIAQLKNDEF